MVRRLVVIGALLTPLTTGPAARQAAPPPSRELVGTWTLVSMQRGTEPPVTNPRGMLAFDRSGHAIEIATRSGRTPGSNPQSMFGSYGGFWGGYRVDEAKKAITFRPDGALNPGAMGADLVRSFEITDERMTITAPPGAPALEQGMRWVWERVPPLENLSAAERQIVGFWQHVVERRVNPDSGAVISETRRAPSVIVYTPSGYVGVHFPPLNRKAFAGDVPTDEEAGAAVRGYVGYYGVYLVYPGAVHHHQLANLNGNVVSFKRFFEISGTEVNLRFPPQMFGGQMVRTQVTLNRLSGVDEMLPR